MSGFSWDRRIARTSELLQNQSSVTELLKFYQRLVRFQKSVYESVASAADHDVSLLVPHFAGLLDLVKESGSADLKATAATLEESSSEDRLELLRAVWQHEVESHELSAESVFFANALLQPFAEHLAEKNTYNTEASPPLCPFCCVLSAGQNGFSAASCVPTALKRTRSICRCSSRRNLIMCAWTPATLATPTSS